MEQALGCTAQSSPHEVHSRPAAPTRRPGRPAGADPGAGRRLTHGGQPLRAELLAARSPPKATPTTWRKTPGR
eukprot:9467524-Pyramimonas_sp.AAC.1